MGSKLDLGSQMFRRSLIKTLLQSTPVSYVLIDRNYKVRFVNDNFLNFRKLDKIDVLGEKCYEVSTNKKEMCQKCIVRDAVNSGRPAGLLRKDILHDGTVTYSDDFAIPIKDESTGNFDYILEVMIDRTKEMQLREQNNEIFLDVINAMIKLLEKKDYYTCLHSRNVSAVSAKLTRYYGLGDKAVFNAALGGLLHDLGKLYIPDNILNKPTNLNEKEYNVIKEHPMFTWLFFTGLNSFNALKDVAIAHHERWDGKGYPVGLKGEEIPVEARITAIADTYDAMTSTRPYRKALAHEAAIDEIKKFAGHQFDPDIVEKFVQMIEENSLDREALVSHDRELSYDIDGELTQYIHETLHQTNPDEHKAETTQEMKNLAAAIQSESFMESVFNNTPAFYTIIDDSFTVLYVSDNLAAVTGKSIQDLVGGKCFDMTDKKMQCFKMDNGSVMCPVVRVFSTGEKQYALLEEDLDGQKLYFDVFAIPITLDDAHGEKLKCCLEIMFDRTREKNIQRISEDDLKKLIVKIRDLVEEILPDVSANIHEIVHEANSFSDYLYTVKTGLSELVSAPEKTNN